MKPARSIVALRRAYQQACDEVLRLYREHGVCPAWREACADADAAWKALRVGR